MEIHVVKSGETPSSISEIYGVNPARMMRDNGYSISTPLVVGQSLVILFPNQIHTVSSGDSVFSVAEQYGITVNQLYRNNYELLGRPSIYPGQTLVISYEGQKLGPLYVNAYAYPYISDSLVRAELPYLTYLTPFTYGITPTGGLVNLDDSRLIATAKEYDVSPLMHLSTITETGNFSTKNASDLLSSAESEALISEAILKNIQTKRYEGLDIDFEYISAEDAAPYAEFVSSLKTLLNENGYPVWVALAPKVSDTQPGTLYEGHNYALLSEAANFTFLMTYEWGYKYSSPQAVAPIPSVTRVLEYALTRIPPERIFLGIPTYGYDWPLPYVKGVTAATSISNVTAINLARNFGAEINYDTTAQSPWFTYVAEDGKAHEVWFEDARSIQAKLKLVNDYSLQGIGYWDLMRDFPQNWIVLNSLYDIISL